MNQPKNSARHNQFINVLCLDNKEVISTVDQLSPSKQGTGLQNKIPASFGRKKPSYKGGHTRRGGLLRTYLSLRLPMISVQ
jgi:hypothetical protein